MMHKNQQAAKAKSSGLVHCLPAASLNPLFCDFLYLCVHGTGFEYSNHLSPSLRWTRFVAPMLGCPGADAKSFHNAMQQAQQDHIYTNPCNWTIPFIHSMPSDHGLETVVYDTTTLPLYLKLPKTISLLLSLHNVANWPCT